MKESELWVNFFFLKISFKVVVILFLTQKKPRFHYNGDVEVQGQLYHYIFLFRWEGTLTYPEDTNKPTEYLMWGPSKMPTKSSCHKPGAGSGSAMAKRQLVVGRAVHPVRWAVGLDLEPEDLNWFLGPAQPLSSSLILGELLEAIGLVCVLVKWRCNCSLPQGIGT